MNRQRVIFWLALMILGLETGAVPVAANMGVGEAIAGLSTSSLWELNRDAGGTLYISDYQLPAVVVVNPTSGAFTRYISPLTAAFVVTPSDAKPDTNGLIWWSDYYSAFDHLLEPLYPEPESRRADVRCLGPGLAYPTLRSPAVAVQPGQQ